MHTSVQEAMALRKAGTWLLHHTHSSTTVNMRARHEHGGQKQHVCVRGTDREMGGEGNMLIGKDAKRGGGWLERGRH
jgi:hypothetical protein